MIRPDRDPGQKLIALLDACSSEISKGGIATKAERIASHETQFFGATWDVRLLIWRSLARSGSKGPQTERARSCG